MEATDPRRHQPSRLRLSAALIGCILLATLQIPVASVTDVVNPPGRLLELWPQSLLWAGISGIWFLGVHMIYRKLQNVTHQAEVFESVPPPPPFFEDHRHVTAALWLGVSAVLCTVILPPMLVGQWTLQPVLTWQGLYGTYGMAGLVAAVGLLLYHGGFGAVTALALAIVQALADTVGRTAWFSKVPMGGVVVGLAAATYQSATGGWAMFVTTLVAFTLLGAVHLLTGRRLRWTVPATAMTLVFLY
ncbi:MAG: hypothetical protein Q4C81_08645 [Kocuria sp.]|nr:hypothetical protein [Kocuria sp.]